MISTKIIVLILTIVMPPNVRDIDVPSKADSFEACWAQAKTFAEKDLTPELKQMGAIGYRASCGFMERPEAPESEKPKGDSF